MAVLDHPVHEKVRIGNDHRYGCWNRVGHNDGYYAPTRRYFPDGSFDMVTIFIPHHMSRDCRFDMSLQDPSCQGCQHRGLGELYDSNIRRHGA